MNQREVAWELMLEKEINNRKDLEEVVRTLSLVDGLTNQERAQVLAGAELTVCINVFVYFYTFFKKLILLYIIIYLFLKHKVFIGIKYY